MEKDLAELVEGLKTAAGANLKAVVLYGSAAGGDFQAGHSDLNVLCVLDRLDGAELQKLSSVARWWEKKGHPAPLVFGVEELHHAADVFAIELLDIQEKHRLLFGENIFAAMQVPLHLHREQVERELRTNLVRLRQRYLSGARNDDAVRHLIIESAPSFLVLFRHALRAMGEAVPHHRHAVVEQLANRLGFDAAGILNALQLRERGHAPSGAELARIFHAYLGAVTHVVEEVDRRFSKPE